MKIVVISDTHGQHARLQLPPGEMLIHAGDLTPMGSRTDVLRFLNWFQRQPFKHKLFIAGNHDFFFERENPAEIEKIIPPGVHYLNDSGTIIEDIHFWGSPVTPWFQHWAFNRHPGADINRHWNLIPANTDILITHGPAFGIQDRIAEGQHIGCKDLLAKVKELQPAYHLFGHIHEGYGSSIRHKVHFMNASVLNEHYTLSNPPLQFEFSK